MRITIELEEFDVNRLLSWARDAAEDFIQYDVGQPLDIHHKVSLIVAKEVIEKRKDPRATKPGEFKRDLKEWPVG